MHHEGGWSSESDGFRTISSRLLHRGRRSIAGGDSSTMRVLPYHLPLVAERGDGGTVWDADGNEYIDLNMAYGPLDFRPPPTTDHRRGGSPDRAAWQPAWLPHRDVRFVWPRRSSGYIPAWICCGSPIRARRRWCLPSRLARTVTGRRYDRAFRGATITAGATRSSIVTTLPSTSWPATARHGAAGNARDEQCAASNVARCFPGTTLKRWNACLANHAGRDRRRDYGADHGQLGFDSAGARISASGARSDAASTTCC